MISVTWLVNLLWSGGGQTASSHMNITKHQPNNSKRLEHKTLETVENTLPVEQDLRYISLSVFFCFVDFFVDDKIRHVIQI